MRIKAVIFDVDGTLIDSNGLHSAAWVETFRHFGVTVDVDIPVVGDARLSLQAMLPLIESRDVPEKRSEPSRA